MVLTFAHTKNPPTNDPLLSFSDFPWVKINTQQETDDVGWNFQCRHGVEEFQSHGPLASFFTRRHGCIESHIRP